MTKAVVIETKTSHLLQRHNAFLSGGFVDCGGICTHEAYTTALEAVSFDYSDTQPLLNEVGFEPTKHNAADLCLFPFDLLGLLVHVNLWERLNQILRSGFF